MAPVTPPRVLAADFPTVAAAWHALGCERQGFFFSSRRRQTRSCCDWSSDVCSSDLERHRAAESRRRGNRLVDALCQVLADHLDRSEERRVGKECRSRWSPHHRKKNTSRDHLRRVVAAATQIGDTIDALLELS